jgi:hypothetical protein
MRHERNFKSASPTQLNLLALLPPVKGLKIPPEVRFRKMLKSQANGCVLFTGAIDPSSMGYGRFREDADTVWLAHRYAWKLQHGTVPALIRHEVCNTPSCCNTSHMSPGTPQDNTDDMIKAGRQRGKLLAEQVELIVKLHRERGMSAEDLAIRFNVSRLAVSKLLDGRTWSKVTGIKRQPKRQKKQQIQEAA